MQKSDGTFNFFDYMVISRESNWKAIFDVVLLFASVYNTFSQAFYSAFGEPD